MPGEIVTLGAARSTHYALRDNFRGLADIPVYRVNAAGQIETLGQLTPVRPDGFVMRDANGQASYHEGLPWWLTDMRPQGFLGRAYARQHATGLGCPLTFGIGVTPMHCVPCCSTGATRSAMCCWVTSRGTGSSTPLHLCRWLPTITRTWRPRR